MVMRKPKAPKAPHTVEPGNGFFTVTSGSSGSVYRIVIDEDNKLLCPCTGFQNRRACSHIDAVMEHAAAALKPPQP